MSGMKPGFITGANARIKLFGKTLAYCADVSYNVTVQTIPIESIGKYEVHSNEPVSYSVDGTFSVIRYTNSANTAKIKDAKDGKGNAPKNIGDNDSNAQSHLDPGQILVSQTFDLEIFQKTGAGRDTTVPTTDQKVAKLRECRLTRRGMTLNKRGVIVDNYAFVAIYMDDSDLGDSNAVGPSGQEDLA